MKRKRVLAGIGMIVVILAFFFFILFLTGHELPFGDRIGVVEIKGVITQSANVIEQLQRYLDDDGVKAIILRIDSPGGGVGPSQEIYREVIKAKTKTGKKVLVSMGSVAASGGYYIACASDLIVANGGTITGSIGVVVEFTNLEDLLKKIGVKGFVLKSGEHKDIGSPFREMSPEEKKILQDVVDNTHQQFIQAVATGRKLDRAKVAEIADGRIFTGEQAKQLGLVDRLGNLQDTIDIAAQMVGIVGKPSVIYPPKKKLTFWDLLFGDMASALIETLKEKGIELSYRLSSP